MRIVLASSSPRRRELFNFLHRPFDCDVPDIDEIRQSNERAEGYVLRLANEKALAVATRQSDECLVIGSDTLIRCDQEVMEKPLDFEHFQKMMRQLSGRTHEVLTSVAVCHWNGQSLVASESTLVTTRVEFALLTTDDIESYWATGEPQDKAGGYGIQGYGGKYVKRIEGSYFAVVGLPLYETEQLLRMFEVTGG
jgi:septum formation protein